MLHGFARLDGFFLNVKEGVDEMIKFLANEPSVGLFFVEQHARTSMPYLLGLKDKVGEKIHEVTLHTEDIEDSICSVRYVVTATTDTEGDELTSSNLRDAQVDKTVMT
ncbi:hypothetical protein MUK42_34027 [Musa troglodytarum]|uniref:Uncharacterized protein n=1 Tax=Musa troglodytarum TaxID=320322 RepID=A0A9E7GKN2_9LILI|nr:hypothetical protein MUK42_34027 [Musa troglodytarum]